MFGWLLGVSTGASRKDESNYNETNQDSKMTTSAGQTETETNVSVSNVSNNVTNTVTNTSSSKIPRIPDELTNISNHVRTETKSEASVAVKGKIPRRADKNYRCGLENNGNPLPKWTPRRRVKTSLATPELSAKCQKIIDEILQTHTTVGHRVKFDPNDIMEVLLEVDRYFISEPAFIEDIPFDVVVVGDILGQLYDVDRAFRIFAKDDKPGYLCKKFVFLGNYINKGRQQLEVLMLLFCLKILYPDNFFLLRGEHEFAMQNYKGAFIKELKERYCEESARRLFIQFNETFSWMSLCAVVGVYFCAHSGISPGGMSRWNLRELSKPIIKSTEDIIYDDMMFAEPALGLRGTVCNYERGSSFFFGLDVLVYSLTRLQCVAFIRGHSIMNTGFDSQWGICHTVFTATNSEKAFNDGGVLWIDEYGKFHVNILKMNKLRYETECDLYGDQEEDANDVKTRTIGEISVVDDEN